MEAELAACERSLLVVRNMADKKAWEYEQRECRIEEKIAELQAAHLIQVQEAKDEVAAQVEAVRAKATSEIAVEVEKQGSSERRSQAAAAAAAEAEEEAVRLQARVHAVHALLASKVQEAEANFQSIRDRCDVDVARLHEESNETVTNAALYASEVQESALATLVEHQRVAGIFKAGVQQGTVPHTGEPGAGCRLGASWPDAVHPLKPCAYGRPRALEAALAQAAKQAPAALAN